MIWSWHPSIGRERQGNNIVEDLWIRTNITCMTCNHALHTCHNLAWHSTQCSRCEFVSKSQADRAQIAYWPALFFLIFVVINNDLHLELHALKNQWLSSQAFSRDLLLLWEYGSIEQFLVAYTYIAPLTIDKKRYTIKRHSQVYQDAAKNNTWQKIAELVAVETMPSGVTELSKNEGQTWSSEDRNCYILPWKAEKFAGS